MNVTAVCITWNRPKLLGRLIHCFHQQDDPDGRLLILDDAGQYPCIDSGRKWMLVSTDLRYPTMGEKRNAAVEYASTFFPQTEAIAVWDDDDVYWPHALCAVRCALESSAWAQPGVVLESAQTCQPTLRRVTTYSLDEPNDICYGGSWAFRLDAFRAVGGYPAQSNTEDQPLALNLQRKYGPSADSSEACWPWYWYNRRPGQMADLGEDAYGIRGRETVEWCDCPPIGWNGPNMFRQSILPGLYERPF